MPCPRIGGRSAGRAQHHATADGRTRPAAAFSEVVLPEPFGPSRATTEPRLDRQREPVNGQVRAEPLGELLEGNHARLRVRRPPIEHQRGAGRDAGAEQHCRHLSLARRFGTRHAVEPRGTRERGAGLTAGGCARIGNAGSAAASAAPANPSAIRSAAVRLPRKWSNTLVESVGTVAAAVAVEIGFGVVRPVVPGDHGVRPLAHQVEG